MTEVIAADGQTVTVRVPFQLRRRGGRKLVVAPDGQAALAVPRPRLDNTLVKAIARAHRWQRLLDRGIFATVSELAAAEKINRSYVCRVLRLTLLSPDIVEALLDGRQPVDLRMTALLTSPPMQWAEQREKFRPIT